MDTKGTKKLSKKVLIIAVAAAVVIGGGVFAFTQFGGNEAAPAPVEAAQKLNPVAKALAADGTDTVEISGDTELDGLMYVSGEKTLTGTGTLKVKGGEYILVVNEGATLTLDGPVLDGQGSCVNGIYVSAGATLNMKSGSVENLTGHGIRVLGDAKLEGGSVKAVGTNWVMVDENAAADIDGVVFTEAGDNGVITGAGSKLTLGSGVNMSGAKASLIYNGGEATVTGGSYSESDYYAIHNDGTMDISDVTFTGAKLIGYVENAKGAKLTISGGKMENSAADFIYNQGDIVISGVEFNNCGSVAIETRGGETSAKITDCTFEEIGRNVVTNRLSTLTMENITIGDCGGYVVQNRGASFSGKNITVNNVGATAFINDSGTDSEAVGCKDFTLDTFSIGSTKEYGFRNNGGTMTLSNGKVGKTADYSLYVRDGEVTTTGVSFAGVTMEGRAVVQIGTSSKPNGTLTMNDTTVTGGARGVTNHGTFTFNSGTIRGNVSAGDLNYGAGVNNSGTMTMNGGTITSNRANQGGGGIYNTGTLDVTGGIIKYNIAKGSGGGISNKGKLTLTGTILFGNKAVKSGGGLYNTGSMKLYGGTVETNRANAGGGIGNSGTAFISKIEVINNTSVSNGGGIYVGSNGKTTLAGAVITGNTAGTEAEPTSGGGIYNLGQTTVRGKGRIVNNVSTKNGSGIYNTSNAILNIENGTIGGGKNEGYALYIYKGSSGSGKVNISGTPDIETIYKSSNAELCIAGDFSGSANVYLDSYKVGTKVFTEAESGLIAANKDKFNIPELPSTKIVTDEGKIAMQPGASFVAQYGEDKYTSIEEAYDDIISDGGTGTITLLDNVDINGQIDILADTDITLDLAGKTITQKASARVMIIHGSLDIKNGTITGGNASNGAGLYVGGGSCTVSGLTIKNCATTDHGAGVYITSGGSCTMNSGTITGCTATGNGAVYVNSGSFTMKGGLIDGNTAKNGSGIYNNTSGVTNISGGKITGTTLIYKGTGNISGGVLTGNLTNGSSHTGTVNFTGGWVNAKVVPSEDNKWFVTGTPTEACIDAPDSSAPYTVVSASHSYTVNFVTNNSSVIDPITGTGAETVTLPEAVPEGEYSFEGWCLKEDLSDTPVPSETVVSVISDTLTLYAKYAVLPDVATLKIGEAEAVGYKTFAKAFAAAEGKTSTLTLLEDVSLSGELDIKEGTTLVIDLNGHNVTQTSKARVFNVHGTFTLNGSGTVSGGKASNGASVNINKGKFTMNGGTITGAVSSSNGSAVYITGSGSFTMNGGSISGCTATDANGTVYVNKGTFTMTGGTIGSNTAKNGAGFYNTSNGVVNVSGGTISSNALVYGGTCTVSGGIFIGNLSNGSSHNGIVNISGGWFKKQPDASVSNMNYTGVITGKCSDAPNADAPYTVRPEGSTYTVTFVSEYGSAPEAATENAGTATVFSAPVYEGADQVFSYWQDENGNTYNTTDSYEFAGNITLNAVWSPVGPS